VLATWRNFLRRERGRKVLLGGYRAVECTARLAKGLHAHLHCLFEVNPDEDDPGYMVRRWLQVAAGSSARGQDIQPADPANIYQCAKYPEDTSGLADIVAEAPGYCRRVLEALVSRRTGEAFGTWRQRLADLRERQPTNGRWYGDACVRSVALGRGVRWAGGGRASASEVLSCLGRWPGEVAPVPAAPGGTGPAAVVAASVPAVTAPVQTLLPAYG